MTSQRDDALAELEREDLEEEKHKKERAYAERMKAVYVFEKLWREENREPLFGGIEGKTKEPEKTREQIVEQIFSDITFVHVKREQVDEILKNPEFAQKHYGTKIRHMDIETGIEYRRMLERELDNAGIKPTGDMEKDEKLFARTLDKANGFEQAIGRLLKRRQLFEHNKKDLRIFDKVLDGLLPIPSGSSSGPDRAKDQDQCHHNSACDGHCHHFFQNDLSSVVLPASSQCVRTDARCFSNRGVYCS